MTPWRRLLEWEAFDQLEPIGGRRGDWQAASICSMQASIAAAHSGSKKRFTPHDFLLEYGDEQQHVEESREKPKSWQELKFIAQMWVADSNARQKE